MQLSKPSCYTLLTRVKLRNSYNVGNMKETPALSNQVNTVAQRDQLRNFTTNILYWRTLKTHHHNFAFLSETANAIEKLLKAYKVQLKIGINQSCIIVRRCW